MGFFSGTNNNTNNGDYYDDNNNSNNNSPSQSSSILSSIYHSMRNHTSNTNDSSSGAAVPYGVKLKYFGDDPQDVDNDVEDNRRRRSRRRSRQRQQQQQQRRSRSRQRRSRSRQRRSRKHNNEYDDDGSEPEALYKLEGDDYNIDNLDDEVYYVRQRYGIFSILFSIVQTIILILMMWQCGIAPIQLNPMIGPYPDALSEWGGKNSVLILEDDEKYRLLTPILLHAGIIHLLGNVLVQLETGAFFEKEWGSIRWLIIYLCSAIGSSICSTIFMPTAVSVGSSGAVMGLFGGKLAEVVLRGCERIQSKQDAVAYAVRKEQCCQVSCSVILVLAFSFIPFVDWAAHVGGLLFGFFIGIPIFAWDVQYVCCKLIWFCIGIACTITAYTVSLTYMYTPGNIELIDELHDVCGYYTENFDGYECNCMRDEYIHNNNNNQNDNNNEHF